MKKIIGFTMSILFFMVTFVFSVSANDTMQKEALPRNGYFDIINGNLIYS